MDVDDVAAATQDLINDIFQARADCWIATLQAHRLADPLRADRMCRTCTKYTFETKYTCAESCALTCGVDSVTFPGEYLNSYMAEAGFNDTKIQFHWCCSSTVRRPRENAEAVFFFFRLQGARQIPTVQRC